MGPGRLKTARLAAVAVLAFVAFNAPLIGVADTGGLVLGLPAVLVYVFAVWAIVAALIALIVGRSR